MVLSSENTTVAEHFVQDLMMQRNISAGIMKGIKTARNYYNKELK